MNDNVKKFNEPELVLVSCPTDQSQTLSLEVKKEIKRECLQRSASDTHLNDDERSLLSSPRQSIIDLESVVRDFMVRLYNSQRAYSDFSMLDQAAWDKKVQEDIDAFIYGEEEKKRGVVEKRDRIRFFAKSISSSRINSIEDCSYFSKEASELMTLNKTRGLIGFVLDNLALLHMTLMYFKGALEAYSGSFAAILLDFIANSLIVLVGIMQIYSIIKENKPLKLQHYAQISFVLTMTSLGLIGFFAGVSNLSIIASSLSIFRNLLIFGSEFKLYLNAKEGSDKQKSHAQSCINALNDLVLSTLALSVMLVVVVTPMPGLVLTAFIILLTIMKLAWQLSSPEQKMLIKQKVGLGKKDYKEVLESDDKMESSNSDEPKDSVDTSTGSDIEDLDNSANAKNKGDNTSSELLTSKKRKRTSEVEEDEAYEPTLFVSESKQKSGLPDEKKCRKKAKYFLSKNKKAMSKRLNNEVQAEDASQELAPEDASKSKLKKE